MVQANQPRLIRVRTGTSAFGALRHEPSCANDDAPLRTGAVNPPGRSERPYPSGRDADRSPTGSCPRAGPTCCGKILLFCGAYWLYRLVRGFTDGKATQAFDNARDVIGLEQHLGLFVEPTIQAWTEGQRWLIDAASWAYVNSHFTVATVTLAFIYLRRNPNFYFIRNMFMVAMGIALVLYAAFPTAPPRFMPEWGFTDSVAQFTAHRRRLVGRRALQPVSPPSPPCTWPSP